jgi:hypothetical protein
MQRSPILFALVTFLGATPAFAADWYVDANSGSNANGGTNAADAWRTISHAVASVPASGVQTIRVAAGTYDAALGEAYPITLRSGLQVIGDQGGARPRLHTASASHLFLIGGGGATVDVSTRLEHLELDPFHSVLWLQLGGGSTGPVLRDLALTEVRGTGIRVPYGAATDSQFVLEGVHCTGDPTVSGSNGATGLDASVSGAGKLTILASDSSFSRRLNHGAELGGSVIGRFARCRFDDNDFTGVRATGFVSNSMLDLEFSDCELADNSVHGFQLAFAFVTTAPTLRFVRSTVANNGDTGIYTQQAGINNFFPVEIDHCVVSGGSYSVKVAAASSVRRSLIADGQFTGTNGNIAGDPLYLDPAQRDYRLTWSSPCVDAGLDAVLPGARDVLGHERELDGNLDTQSVVDLGAFEFRPLEIESTGQIGSTLALDVWGPQGAASIVYWTRTGLVGAQPTPFGSFVLDSNSVHVFKFTSAGAAAPTQILRQIPNQPLLVGRTFAFQALTDSLAAPLAKAFTNGVEVTFVP